MKIIGGMDGSPSPCSRMFGTRLALQQGLGHSSAAGLLQLTQSLRLVALFITGNFQVREKCLRNESPLILYTYITIYIYYSIYIYQWWWKYHPVAQWRFVSTACALFHSVRSPAWRSRPTAAIRCIEAFKTDARLSTKASRLCSKHPQWSTYQPWITHGYPIDQWITNGFPIKSTG